MLRKKDVINEKRIIFLNLSFLILLITLIIRLAFLQINPSEKVSGEMNNYQLENLSQMKYRIFDTNGKDLLDYSKKYIIVLDSKPFMLNNYEETLKDLMALNFIMKSEIGDFNYSDVMKSEGKIYYTVSEETFNKVNKLKNIKGIYTYIYDEIDNKEAWTTSNFLANIKEENIVEDSLEFELYQYLKDNEYPQGKFYMDDGAGYEKGVLLSSNKNNNIKLTIYQSWEESIREVLKEEKYSFLKNVGVVVSEAGTGKIKAMVQRMKARLM